MAARSPSRRTPALHPLVFLVAFTALLLAPMLGAMAQSDPVRTSPTETPANPGSFQVEPTREPTREPERTSPTQMPEAPTEEPEPAAPSSLTLHKGACDDGNFDPYTATGLDSFLEACASPDGEFEFTVFNNVAFTTTQSTELGTLFMQLPTGPVTIVETIPAGWGDPAVFCWSNLFPTPSATPHIGNSPVWDVAEGEDVECWWFNVAGTGQDVSENVTVVVGKLTCPASVSSGADLAELRGACNEPMEGVTFTLQHKGERVPAVTDERGFAQWPDAPFTSITIAETIPAGFGDPIVWCSFFDSYIDLWQGIVPGENGVITLDIPDDATNVICTYFNISATGGTPASDDGPGSLLDPGLQEGQVEVLEHDVTITKRTCPAGTDPTQSLEAYQNLCPTTAGIEFALEYGAGATSTTTTNASGEISWLSVADGPFEIRETNHIAYAQQIAFCRYDGVGAPWQATVIDGALQGVFGMGLPPGTGSVHLICDWVNIESDTTATLTVIKHRCPLGVPEDATLDQYLVICAELFDGVTFTLEHSGASFPGLTANGGQVEWTDVPAGPLTLVETNPGGFKDPRVFCHFFQGEQELLFGQEEFSLIGHIPLVVPHDATDVLCSVINIPNPDANSITVHKRLCPVGFDFATDDHYAECTEPMGGVTFTLGDMEATTGDDQGVAIFPNLPAGDHQLTEIMPEGIAYGWVDICVRNEDQGVIPLGDDGPPSVTLDVDTGDHWVCHIYNVPDEVEENSITIRKWQCPEGAGPDQAQDWFEANCLAQHDGVQFEITLDIGVIVLATTGGTAAMGPFPMSHVEIQEEIPDGFGSPVVFCMIGEGGWQPYAAPTGFWDHAFEDNGVEDTLICHVYNIPAGDNDIVIQKWECPAGFDPNSSDQEFFDTCATPLDGITFKAMSDLGIAVLDTVGGQVGFGGFPTGTNVGIQEEIPPEYGNPYVICEFDDGAWHDVGASNGFFEIFFAGSGETVECHVFNIPGDDPDLTILKWTCPEGYDLFAFGADPHADCTQATNGVEFELRYSGHDDVQQSQVTGDLIDGGVVFEDLQPDTYHVTEIVPPGIDSAFVLECTGHIMGVLQPYPLQMGNVLDNIGLDAGEHLVCHWFNVPEIGGGDLTLIKYTCATEAFVSEVDCQIEEVGITFDLVYWTGTWDLVDTETTDGFGRIQWTGLDAGEYWFEEHDGEWCHISSDMLEEDGPWVVVPAGQETVVKVYNCDGTPGIPGETPTKYPNTGTPRETEPIHHSGRGLDQYPLAS